MSQAWLHKPRQGSAHTSEHVDRSKILRNAH